MKHLVVCACVCALMGAGSALHAQQNYAGHAYGIFGLGSGGGKIGDFLSAGVGGEAFAWKGLAAGGDIVYFWPHVSPSSGIGLVSIGPAWHFVRRENPGKLVPFVNGGYTLAFRSGTANLWYLGGGATWWIASRAGLRLEYRHTGQRGFEFDNSIRFGIAIR
jgi:hypothetical protein